MIGFSFFLTGEEEEDQVESIQDAFVRSMTLDFELPSNFLHPERYPNVDLADALFSRVPSVVSSALFDAMPESIPIDPQMPFIFLRQSRLPEFVVAWFMAFLPKKRVGRMNRFFSSMNAIEQYREFVFFPPTDPNLYDPIVAAGGRFGLRGTTAILPRVQFSSKQNARQITAGANFSWGLDYTSDGDQIIAGMWYRYGDAIMVNAGARFSDLQIILSYDLNASGLTPASNGYGATEISIIYLGKRKDRRLDCPNNF